MGCICGYVLDMEKNWNIIVLSPNIARWVMMKQQRKSRQRQQILDAVQTRCDHPTADQIYLDVRAKDERISRGTVYRNLGVLSEDGQITNVKVFAAAVVAAEQGTKNQEQGQKGHILVPCGDGNYIELLELQLPGKKRMDAKSLLNGLK